MSVLCKKMRVSIVDYTVLSNACCIADENCVKSSLKTRQKASCKNCYTFPSFDPPSIKSSRSAKSSNALEACFFFELWYSCSYAE